MEAILSNISSIFIFIVFLSILIVVHEWGHFITAKKLGVKVEKFSLGFGPKLFSKMHNGTEFLICAVPLGGYVKMAGDEKENCKGTSDEFFSKSPGHRSLIVLNGPVVNFILAYVSIAIVFMIGYPDLSNRVGKVIEGYPAQAAGLKEGDTILKVNDQKIENWSDVQQNIAKSETGTIKMTILRDAKEENVMVEARVENMKNIFGQEQKKKIVGIQPGEEIISLKYDFFTSLKKSFEKLVEISVVTYKSIYFMITGSMSPKESMTGPVGIFLIVKAAAEMGINHLLYILGVISASLALFNLLPVVPLDGGHLLMFGIEKLRGHALSAKIEEFIGRVGFSLIVLLALFVFYTDFSRLGWIDHIRKMFP